MRAPELRHSSWQWAVWALAGLTMLCVFVPFSVRMPQPGLDPSWALGMNAAVAGGLVFGRDMVFTFGPLAAVYTHLYHPATDLATLIVGVFLASSGTLALVLALHGRPLRALLLTLLLAFTYDWLDIGLLVYPLLVGLVGLRWAFDAPASAGVAVRRFLALALMTVSLGLLPLIKGSLGLMALVLVMLLAAAFAWRRQPVAALLVVATPLLACVAGWLARGQPLAAWPGYFAAMVPIVSGYTEAMSLRSKIGHPIAYVLAAGLLLWGVATRTPAGRLQRAALLLLFSLLLLLAFKAGFVRHDGHALTAALVAVAALLVAPFPLASRFGLLSAVPALACAGTVLYMFAGKPGPLEILDRTLTPYFVAWDGLGERLRDPAALPRRYAATLANLRRVALFPSLQGPADIYSYGQAYLIGAGLEWSPRPVLQSYSAYTPALAEMNRQHLLGPRAPQHVIFAVQAIDGRLPSSEDGPSWPVLLTTYRPAGLQRGFLFLERSTAPVDAPALLPLQESGARFGEPVMLPASSPPRLFARLDIRPSWLGRLVALLYKPPELQIELTLADGSTRRHRLVSGLARAGFVVSPMVDNTQDFVALYGPDAALAGKRVRSFTVAPAAGPSRLWQPAYGLVLSALPAPPAGFDPSMLRPRQAPVALPAGVSEVRVGTCEGSIDQVNEQKPPPTVVSAQQALTVDGWLTTAVRDSALPDALFAVLTDGQGRRHYLPARRTPRPDVAAHFGRLQLQFSGYHSETDIRSLAGPMQLGLALQLGTELRVCNHVGIPLEIRN